MGPPRGDDRGQAAGHRLEHRHGEALAAVGMDEHVAGAIQRGHLAGGEVLVDEHDAGQRAGRDVLADRLAPGVAIDVVGAEVLEHEGDVVAPGERLAPRVEEQVGALARDQPAHEEKARALARPGQAALGAVRTEDLQVHAVGDRHDAVGLDPGVEVHPAHELAGHPQLVDVRVQRGKPVLRDRSELPRLDDRQPPRAGGGEVRGPLVAHLDVRGVDQRRGRCLGGIAVDALHRAAQAAGDPVVDDGQARGQAVVALPAHGGRLGGRVAVHARRAGAPVVGLELVDVGGEGAGLGDAGLELLEQPRLGGQAIERAREVVDVEAVEGETVDPVADGLGQAARGAGRAPGSARPGTRRRPAGRSPTTSRAARPRRRRAAARRSRRARRSRTARRCRGDPGT